MEDVGPGGWTALLDCIGENGSQIKIMDLQCANEVDRFAPTTCLSSVLQKCKNLGCMRLERVPLVKLEIIPTSAEVFLEFQLIVASCRHLTVVILDQCFGDLSIIPLLWSNLDSLNFLGVSGLEEGPFIQELKPKVSLKTLRIVDCPIADHMVIIISKKDLPNATKCTPIEYVACCLPAQSSISNARTQSNGFGL